MSCAVRLRCRGWTVALVDRHAPGEGASFGNGGLIQREAVFPHPLPYRLAKPRRVAGSLGRDVFTRSEADENGTVRAGRTGDITALLRTSLAAIRLPPDAGALFRAAKPPFWSVSDAIERIRKMLLLVEDEGTALETFLWRCCPFSPERELRCRVAVAETFLAGLELARGGHVTVQQETAWASVQVRRGQGRMSSETVL